MCLTHVRFDEIENVLASLDMLGVVGPLVAGRRGKALWKWVIVGAQDAVQGALVCAVADTTGTNVLKEESAKKMLEWLSDSSKKYPGEYMADFKTLLMRAAVELPSEDAVDIERLHGLRNGLAHFTPQTWAIELGGLPRFIDAALRLVEKLMRSDKVEHRMTGNKKRRMRDNMWSVRTGLGIKT